MAAKELTTIMEKVMGKRKPKSVRRKIEFYIAPGLSIDCRSSLLISKHSIPTLKKKVVIEKDHNDDPMIQEISAQESSALPDTTNSNNGGKELLSDFTSFISHYDAENANVEVDATGEAFRYGSDLVPMSGYDMNGLKVVSSVKLTVLGYMPVSKIPKSLLVGPPQVLTGADSRKACAAISAIARALHRKKHVGIGTFVKTKNTDPILVGIFPMVDDFLSTNSNSDHVQPIHLILLQLPFAGDSVKLSKPNFDDVAINQTDVCENLIDSLMLDDDELDYREISNPLIRSYWKTVIERVVNPDQEIISVRNEQEDDMKTPAATLKKARTALKAFYDAFPLPSAASNKDDGKKK